MENEDKIITLLTQIKNLLQRQEQRMLRDEEWINAMKRITKRADPGREESE